MIVYLFIFNFNLINLPLTLNEHFFPKLSVFAELFVDGQQFFGH